MKIIAILLTGKQIARFWSDVDIKTDKDCWSWCGSLDNRDRYGYFWANNKGYLAHRVAWTLTYGPTNLDVLHTCDHPDCCNPHHMYLGTDIDNAKDRKLRNPDSYRHTIGEKNGWSIVSDKDAEEIGRRYIGGESTSSLSLEFGVTNISQLVRHRLHIKAKRPYIRRR